ncbi:LysR substrate-binding domain-containing protein [Veronia nyctiphanis]|uniref:LysR substrate-binding domain-containing protein n=1 Tax=Veronia nyctiphanis TaxID=1278244 RepID=UPI002E253FD2
MEFDFVVKDERVDLIKSRIDIAIRVAAMDEMGFVARKLFDDKLELFASQQYLSRLKEPITTQNLISQRWVLINGLSNGEVTMEKGTEKIRFVPTSYIETNSPAYAKELIVSGQGIGLLINNITRDCVETGNIVKLLPGWSARDISCYLLYPSRQNLAKRMQVFINFLMSTRES